MNNVDQLKGNKQMNNVDHYQYIKNLLLNDSVLTSLPTDEVKQLCLNLKHDIFRLEAIEASTVQIKTIGGITHGNFIYSKDNETWQPLLWISDSNITESISLNPGEVVKIVAASQNETLGTGYVNRHQFVLSGKLAAHGNIQYLLDINGQRTDVPGYGFTYLFGGCSQLVKAPDLSATEVGKAGYMYMFFQTSIGEAPALPAASVKDQAYASMFASCSSLSAAKPVEAKLPSASYCLNMFQGCTSLLSAEICARSLPPDSRCFDSMFSGCSSLSCVKTYFSDWSHDQVASNLATKDWLKDVSAKGVFVCNSALDVSEQHLDSPSYVPSGWSIADSSQTYIDKLNVTESLHVTSLGESGEDTSKNSLAVGTMNSIRGYGCGAFGEWCDVGGSGYYIKRLDPLHKKIYVFADNDIPEILATDKAWFGAALGDQWGAAVGQVLAVNNEEKSLSVSNLPWQGPATDEGSPSATVKLVNDNVLTLNKSGDAAKFKAGDAIINTNQKVNNYHKAAYVGTIESIDTTANTITLVASDFHSENIVAGKGISVQRRSRADRAEPHYSELVFFRYPYNIYGDQATMLDGYVGRGAFAAGHNCTATAFGSFSCGSACRSDGKFSMSTGYSNKAYGYCSFVTGQGSESVGEHSASFGQNTKNNADFAFAWNGKTGGGSTYTVPAERAGTFNINPAGANTTDMLNNIYVGNKRLLEFLDQRYMLRPQ